MSDKYIPGMLSHLYQNLSSSERSPIDKRVDDLFRKETGIAAKLDWKSVRDRPHVRTWLRIRDVVIAKYFLEKVRKVSADFALHHEHFIRELARDYQQGLAGSLGEKGLPKIHAEPASGVIIETAHLAVEAFDVTELTGLWPLILGTHVAHLATLYVTGIVGPFITLLGGLYAIGHANEAGQIGAERNAFKWGFAETIAAMAERRDWQPTLPRNTSWGHQQARGRNAAIRMVKEMGQDVGNAFLKRYRGHVGKATILLDVGGYD